MIDPKTFFAVDVVIKDGTAKFAEILTQQIYIATQKAAEVYLIIAQSNVRRATHQLMNSGQIHLIEAQDTNNFSIPNFIFEVSFGRRPGSKTESMVWKQTEAQQKILNRNPLQKDRRAIATEQGFYAWEVRKKRAWRRTPYLYQGLPLIFPAFVDSMNDWEGNISSWDLARSYNPGGMSDDGSDDDEDFE